MDNKISHCCLTTKEKIYIYLKYICPTNRETKPPVAEQRLKKVKRVIGNCLSYPSNWNGEEYNEERIFYKMALLPWLFLVRQRHAWRKAYSTLRANKRHLGPGFFYWISFISFSLHLVLYLFYFLPSFLLIFPGFSFCFLQPRIIIICPFSLLLRGSKIRKGIKTHAQN